MKLEKVFYLFILGLAFLMSCSENKISNQNTETKMNPTPPVGFGNSNFNISTPAEDYQSQQETEQKSFIELRDEEKRKRAMQAQQNPAPVDMSKHSKTRLSDGSEYWAILDEKGVTETREFKDHPQLKRIEKFTQGKTSTIKAYLKNGQIINIPSNKIRDFAQDTAEQILTAAGIKTQQKTVESKSKEEQKGKEEQ